MRGASKKKVRQYSEEYLKFGFISAVFDESLPFCLYCQQCLANKSMKTGCLEAHLKVKNNAHIDSALNYFKKQFEKRVTTKSLFIVHNATANGTLEANYPISLHFLN
ncbi:uncharacterized protein TNCT_584071 [Trichonephila clavata]|uniref:Uncharacterized protein n=1 Tax=Trichonephila clavata TaxID=2740835 RepID=A0A8X6FQW0_TRICU|nr:uncharacterized protein TNCT_584071 [Trichonephila clavata]